MSAIAEKEKLQQAATCEETQERASHRNRGRVFVKKELCKECRFCVEFCPRHTLAMSRDLNEKGYHYPVIDKDNCTGCDLCGMLCPDFAIYGIRLKSEGK